MVVANARGLSEGEEILKALGGDVGARFAIGRFGPEGRGIESALGVKDFASRNGLSFCLSIGGCEAIRDIQDAKILGADLIHAPLIESDFALKKFGQALEKVYAGDDMPRIGFSIESDMGYGNSSTMLAPGGLAEGLVSRAGFVFLGFSYFDLAVARAAKARNLDVVVSGGIHASAVTLLTRLLADGQIDGFVFGDVCFYPQKRDSAKIAALLDMEFSI